MVNFMDFYYTAPGTLAGQYIRKFWHPVFRAGDLKPGWAKPIKILGEKFGLYRGTAARHTSLIFVAPIGAPSFRSAGRGRLHPLFLSRLEIRRRRPISESRRRRIALRKKLAFAAAPTKNT